MAINSAEKGTCLPLIAPHISAFSYYYFRITGSNYSSHLGSGCSFDNRSYLSILNDITAALQTHCICLL